MQDIIFVMVITFLCTIGSWAVWEPKPITFKSIVGYLKIWAVAVILILSANALGTYLNW